MNSISSRQSPANSNRSRRALVQPRLLLASMAFALCGAGLLARAQTGRAPVKMTPNSNSAGAGKKAKTLADLPGMVEAYGQSRQAKKSGSKSGSNTLARTIGTGTSGFNLVETDLTPNTPSDEREPTTSPGGDFIAFVSNGVDTDPDGAGLPDGRIDAVNAENKYHLWVMNRDGSNQRQVTGLFDDRGNNQRRPTWSPDGNQLAYIDGDGTSTELFITQPLVDNDGATAGVQVGRPSRRTFLNPDRGVTLRSPAWSPGGQTIVFAADGNLDGNSGDSGNSFNLFSIEPTGDISTLVRLTGGSRDTTPGGSATTPVDDLNPAFSLINSNVLYFSSNRTLSGISTGRRIWRMFVDGTGMNQVTDPLQRTDSNGNLVGTAGDIDDFPAVSLADAVQERVAFQTNTSIDTSDVEPNGARDFNIWSLPLSSFFPPPVPETVREPRIFISDFTGNRVFSRNPLTGQPNIAPAAPLPAGNPEGVVAQGGSVYVANRGTNQILRFNEETGVGGAFTAANSVPAPAGMISDGQFFYVAPGINATPVNTVAIYRFNAGGGSAGLDAVTSAAFSFGEVAAADRVTNGTEGLAFSAGNDREFIYTSNISDNKVNVYRRRTGQFIKTFVTPGLGGLSFPTDLTFGPDLNKDGFDDLYVNSSGNDDVKAYAGPNFRDINAQVGTPTNIVAPGAFLGNVVEDNEGTVSNLNAPEGIDIIQRDDGLIQIFVSSFQNFGIPTTANGTGDHVNRYTIDPATLDASTPATVAATIIAQPAPRGATNPDIPRDATYLTVTGARGLGYFDFNALARASLASRTGLPVPTPTPTPRVTPLEDRGAAEVVTNVLSSPNNFRDSGIKPQNGVNNVSQDKAEDVEPTFSRIRSSAQLAARIAFSSTRRFAPLPSSNLPDENGNVPGPSNPFGEGTHDIWSATTADTTPPILIPQAAGNQLFPVVSPGPQAPFFAPRTAESGLRAGGNVTVAVVLSELESGIDLNAGNITASFYRAGNEQFQAVLAPNVNESVDVNIQIEGRPPVESSVTLRPFDDGPPSQGGNERQAGAISGDGVYYCVATTATPAASGDFYMDVDVLDRAGNFFSYDNVWGFSTQTFSKQSPESTLFVSDHTTGQQFPLILTSNGFTQDFRFFAEGPVESYYLTNNGGQIEPPPAQPAPPAAPIIFTSVPTTFQNADVWRILSRGPVSQTVIDAYKPRVTQQISPNPQDDPTFTQRKRELPVADSFIVWAAPFAANSFVGPGTITDATTHANLTNFLDAGGRLFVTGRDVAFALSNESKANSDFLGNELGANFAGEVTSNLISLEGGRANGFIALPTSPALYPDTYFDLQVADNLTSQTDTLRDAALTQDPTQTGGIAGVRIDTITPSGNGTTIPVYSIGGATVGQKIEQTRANGFQSRTVFFSFGLEAINRRYRVATQNLPLIVLDTRTRIAAGLARYFKTNRITGNVKNDRTDQNIPNFLVRVSNGADTYLARTDANGNYELSGIPGGGYVVEPAFLLNGQLVNRNTPGAQTSPAGFFAGTTVAAPVNGGSTATANLRPIPITPGTISGRVVTSKGTPNVFSDDLPQTQKAVNMAVLLRSVRETSASANGGRFAALTRTNFNGNFTFSNVPAGIEMELVFNPRLDDPATPADEEDIPIESGLRRSYELSGGPKADVGRRVIPDARRPGAIVAPVGNRYVVNDPNPADFSDPTTGPAAGSPGSDTPADSGVPIVVPEGSNVSGVVTLNGVPVGGARVELLNSSGQKLNPERTVITNSSGFYSFVDVVPGTYLVKVTTILPDGLEVVKTSSPITPAVKDVTVDFKLFLAKVTGLVTRDGKPQAGASVQLLDANGKSIVINQTGGPFTLVRTTTTDNGTRTNYTLTNVPPGRYTIKASLGDASGSVVVTVSNSRDLVAPNINLVPQNLTGVVNLRIDGVSRGGLAGAEIELLNSSGNSLNPRIVTVSGPNGVFGFGAIAAGTYKLRASYKGDTDISATFTVRAGVTSRQTLTIDLQTVTVTVFGPQGRPQAGATVSLLRGTTVVQTLTAGGDGIVRFTEVAAGAYTVTASSNGLTQTVAIVVVERQALSVSLQLFNTTFANNGIFPISLPYATDSIGLTVDQAFNLPLSSRAYKIFFFDAAKQVNKPRINTSTQVGDFKEITSGSTRLVRGMGYVLQTFDTPISIRTPLQNSALKPFTGTTFSIPLTWNTGFLSQTGERDNRNNGYNLIGFPFDPARFRSVNFADSQLTYGNVIYKTLTEAVAAGIISRQVYTLNSAGVRVTTNDSEFRPFVGYFVRILRNDQPIRLILRNPK